MISPQKTKVNANTSRIIKLSPQHFLVESSDSTIFYKVSINSSCFCTCHDYSFNAKKKSGYQCEHIKAVLEARDSEVREAEYLNKSQVELDERYIKKIDGKEFVLYQGLLDLSHKKLLKRITVKLIQHPSEENGREAICMAMAETYNGEVFSDIGDANPSNCDSSIAPHLIRMASTRAKARALRDMNNIGMTALEELGSDAFKSGNGSKNGRSQAASNKSQSSGKKDGSNNSGTSKPMSEAQKRAIENLANRRKLSAEDLAELIEKETGKKLDKLTSTEASKIIQHLTKQEKAA